MQDCDEFFAQSPTYPSEFVEVYTPAEVVHQTHEVSPYQQEEFVEEKCEWSAVDSAPNDAATGTPIQLGTQLPAHIMLQDQFGENFRELAESDFVNEIGRELPLWNDDPCFAKEMAAEGTTFASEEAPNQEISQELIPNIDDLYDYIWNESYSI